MFVKASVAAAIVTRPHPPPSPSCCSSPPKLIKPSPPLLLGILRFLRFKESNVFTNIGFCEPTAMELNVFLEKINMSHVGEQLQAYDVPVITNIVNLLNVVTVKVPGQKPWFAWKQEMQDGILVYVQNAGDIVADGNCYAVLHKIQKLHKTAQKRGTQVQPPPLTVRPVTNEITCSYIISKRVFQASSDTSY